MPSTRSIIVGLLYVHFFFLLLLFHHQPVGLTIFNYIWSLKLFRGVYYILAFVLSPGKGDRCSEDERDRDGWNDFKTEKQDKEPCGQRERTRWIKPRDRPTIKVRKKTGSRRPGLDEDFCPWPGPTSRKKNMRYRSRKTGRSYHETFTETREDILVCPLIHNENTGDFPFYRVVRRKKRGREDIMEKQKVVVV